MAVALILSSSVAANRIGGQAQALALAALGLDPILIPTVQFGAGPHKGGRGQATDAGRFAAMLDDVDRLGLLPTVDLVLTGHFSHPEQVRLAAGTIGRVRAANPSVLVIIDPILGDEPNGLYVRPEVAEAVVSLLVPLAGWLTPNTWELGHLTGSAHQSLDALAAAALGLPAPVLVTSAPVGEGRIGLILAQAGDAHLLTHPRQPAAPNGTGDVLAALFGAGLVEGHAALGAAARAAAAVADLCAAAHESGAPDLPIVALRDRLSAPKTHVGVERLG